MDADEYFERVLRFLETKGWNTSRTQINATTYVVTGTRRSESYYDRMLAMVVVDQETILSPKHVEYLANAGAENDVDHLLATCRAGMDEDAGTLAEEHDVQFIKTDTIDDAFIDGFGIENGSGLVDRARDSPSFGPSTGAVGTPLQYAIGLFALVGVVFALSVLLVEGLAESSNLAGTLVVGALLLAAPVLAVVLGIGFSVGRTAGFRTRLGLCFGAGLGYLLLVLLLGVAASLTGTTGTLVVFSDESTVLRVVLFAVPVALLAVAAASLHTTLAFSPDREL